MTINDPEVVYILICGLVLVSGLIAMGFGLYLSFFRMSELLGGLARSLCVQKVRGMLDAGLYGRLYVFFTISMLLVFPKMSIRRGYLDVRDFESFPRSLRKFVKFVKVVDVVSMFCGISFFLLGFIGEYYGFI